MRRYGFVIVERLVETGRGASAKQWRLPTSCQQQPGVQRTADGTGCRSGYSRSALGGAVVGHDEFDSGVRSCRWHPISVAGRCLLDDRSPGPSPGGGVRRSRRRFESRLVERCVCRPGRIEALARLDAGSRRARRMRTRCTQLRPSPVDDRVSGARSMPTRCRRAPMSLLGDASQCLVPGEAFGTASGGVVDALEDRVSQRRIAQDRERLLE